MKGGQMTDVFKIAEKYRMQYEYTATKSLSSLIMDRMRAAQLHQPLTLTFILSRTRAKRNR